MKIKSLKKEITKKPSMKSSVKLTEKSATKLTAKPLNIEWVNRSSFPIPKKKLLKNIQLLFEILSNKKTNPFPLKNKSALKKTLTIIFTNEKEIKKINSNFRGQKKSTDILSFQGLDPQQLGEIILCVEKIKSHAKAHHLTMDMEATYLILHGILHLLGYDHEHRDVSSQQMFQIQDHIFEMILMQSQ